LDAKTADPDLPKIIVGNKTDLVGDFREVPRKIAEEFCASRNLIYLETSAKEDTNVQETFQRLLDIVVEHKKGKPLDQTVTNQSIKLTVCYPEEPKEDLGGCC
jgi:Ras-related protein Rab-8A